MKKAFLFFLLVIITLTFIWANTDKRPLTVDDYLNIVTVRDVQLSPDGTRVFYGFKKLDWPKNDYKNIYFMCDSDGKNKKIFLREDLKASHFKFSPDGNFLSFISKADKKSQIFLIPVDGGEAQKLTKHAVNVKDYRWQHDSSAIIFSAEEARSSEEQKEYELGADAVFVDEAPNGRENAHFSRLWYFDLKTKKETVICEENLVISDFDVSRDGKRIVFVGRPDRRTNYPFLAELFTINTDGTDFLQITKNKGPEDSPKWSPNGKTILFHASYLSVEKGKFDLHNGYFWLLDMETGKFRRLESQKQGESYGGISAWGPEGKYFYFNELHGINTNLYRIQIKTDTLEAMTGITGTLWTKSFSADMQKMAFTLQDYKTPADLYVSDLCLENQVRITDANPWIRQEILLSSARTVQWKSKKDGLKIEGMFFLPGDHRKGDKVPMVVHIHGGPAGVVESLFRPLFHIYGGLGYAVLGPNYRGSTGYGDKILRGLMGEVGDGEHTDVMGGVDYVIKNFDINPNKLAVRGWSWGGVSTGYLITHVHRFKAAMAGAGVYNWFAETGPGFNFDVTLWYIGCTPWENPQEWTKRSAFYFAKNVKTPTLLIHGGADTTSSFNQSLMYFTALRDIGKIPVRYIKLPRQGHGIDEPRLQRTALVEEIRWFKKYVEEKDWQPVKRK